MTDSLSFAVVNDLSEIPRMAARVEEFCAARRISAKIVYRFNLSLDEVLTNIISHGLTQGRHEIAVSIALDDGNLVANVSDDGPAFDPLSAPAPDIRAPIEERKVGGLGIHLLRTLMDAVEYRRADGRNHLTFRIRVI
jgi:serine/threonine-protein kinase RsbW/sigma-B regulation protein RsbU (phosphoserine phosphatase)